ncbi:GyrI-like domain-containing protein, partial [Myxococcota bacterium]
PVSKLDPEAAKIIDAAIEATGSIEKLKALESFVINDYQSEIMGIKRRGKFSISFNEMLWRLDYADPAGKTEVCGAKMCWEKIGQVVVPGEKFLADVNKFYQPLFRGTLLWPLKEEAGWKIASADDEKLGDKTYKALRVSAPGIEKEATFLFDPESHYLVAMRVEAKMGENAGDMINEYLDFKDICGIKFHTKEKFTFLGQHLATENLGDIKCQAVDPKIFEKPQQVADGTIVEKQTAPTTVACTKMKGPYEKTGETIGKLMGFMKKQQLPVAGAPMMIYLKGPPKVKKPKKFVTEICFPVAAKAPKKPKKKGKFVIKAMKPRKVLAAYGVGPYETKSPELMKLLMAEAKKRKLKPAGPMCQISFMDPKETAAEELVSEMQIPIKGGKKKKK